MSLSNLFTRHLPSLDLHGLDRETARVYIEDFILENIKLKNRDILIIHGIGTGILKQTTHQVLRNHKQVVEYQIDFYNTGSTIVRLKI